MIKKWLSNYDKCDMCTGPIKNHVPWFVDGRVTGNSYWALMCPICFKLHGVGLGLGKGQKYDGTTAEFIDNDL